MKKSTKLTLLTIVWVVSVILLSIVFIEAVFILDKKIPFSIIVFIFFGTWAYFYLRKKIKQE